MFKIHIFEIQIIKIIQLIKADWVTQFFLMINVFDNNYIYLMITIIIWNFFEARKGLEFLYLQVVGATVCSVLKLAFALPRPYELDAGLKILGRVGYGFPSGAATAATLCFGYIFLRLLKPEQNFLKIAALFMIFLVGLTRVYLGAHFISDVIGGYFLGAFILTLYFYSKKYLGLLLEKQSVVVQLLIHISFLSVLFISCGLVYLLPIYVVLLSALLIYFYKISRERSSNLP